MYLIKNHQILFKYKKRKKEKEMSFELAMWLAVLTYILAIFILVCIGVYGIYNIYLLCRANIEYKKTREIYLGY